MKYYIAHKGSYRKMGTPISLIEVSRKRFMLHKWISRVVFTGMACLWVLYILS